MRTIPSSGPIVGWTLVVSLLGAPACFDPDLPANITCEIDLICPDGHFCDPDGFICRRLGQSGDPDAGGDGDASPDGPSLSAFCADDDIALCLEFEDTIEDGSARQNDVTVRAGTPSFIAGVSGQGVELNGTVAFDIRGYRSPSPAETIELWLTVPTNNQTQTALDSSTAVTVSLSAQNVQVVSADVVVSPTLSTADPHHVAIRIDGDEVEVFVDGSTVGVVGFADNDSTPDVMIGAALNQTDFYVGMIDQLRIWTRALSAQEIDDIAGSVGD